jgi:hypothetical protein
MGSITLGRCADELLESNKESSIRQSSLRGFGDAEVYDLRNRHTVVDGHQNVRWLDVAVNDTLLVSVLDGLADLHEQVEPLARGELVLVGG